MISFATTLPSFVGPGLEAFLIDHGVEISAKPIEEGGNPWATLLFSFGPGLLFIGFYVWMFRRAGQQAGGMGAGLMGIGKSKARRYDQEKDAKVTFDDVAGIDEAENELVEIVDFLRDPRSTRAWAAPLRKACSWSARRERERPCWRERSRERRGAVLLDERLGVRGDDRGGGGGAGAGPLQAGARARAGDHLHRRAGRHRSRAGAGGDRGSSEQEQTLNQILSEMDGFSSREGIIVLAATNQPDVLDQALLRPGRFDRRVVVNLPDKTGREAILKVHTRRVPLASDVRLGELAAVTPGLSGADLKNLVNEAALLAARREQNEVRHQDFLDALEKIVLGPERPLLLSRADKERIAYHEGGHTILGLVVPGADPVNRVTIVPRGQALGVTYQRPDSDRYNYPEAYLRARIVGHAGRPRGRGVVYGTKTTGAESDIEQATGLARRMVTRWGMSERVGLVQLAPRENPYLRRLGRVRGSERRSARRRPKPSMPRCSGSSPKATRRPGVSSARTARSLTRSPKPCCRGDPQRAGNPRGHGAPAGVRLWRPGCCASRGRTVRAQAPREELHTKYVGPHRVSFGAKARCY